MAKLRPAVAVCLAAAVGLWACANTTPQVPPPSAQKAELNPHVRPPSPRVVVSPDLPAVTPPAGFVSQQEAITKGAAFIAKGAGGQGGQLTLAGIRVTGDQWELEFRPDGRGYTLSSGPRPMGPKQEYSHVVILDRVVLQLDGRTGEYYGMSTSGSRLDTTRTDLEHYRGRIVAGGNGTTLRLVTEAGDREGRDLLVWAPEQALKEGGLAFWQLKYGAGRLLDVWGLTGTEGQVVAYRVAMAEPPPEALLDLDVVHGIPIHPEARPTKGISRNGVGYILKGLTEQAVQDWYLEQMGRFGWRRTAESGLSFENEAWDRVRVQLRPQQEGVELFLQWGEIE